MGIFFLVFASIGLYQAGKWAVFKALPKRDVAVATDSCVTAVTQQVQSEAATPVEQSWAGYEAPTFIRRGMPYPVLVPKLNAAPAPLEAAFPVGDWTLFANIEGDHHVATH